MSETDRTEAVERAALEDLNAAADQEIRDRLAIAGQAIGDGYASIAAALPASAIVVNRVIGLGLSEPASAKTVAEIIETYRAAGVSRYFLHHHPAAQPADMADLLEAAGLEKRRGWQKFERGREAPPVRRTDLSIRQATAADAPAFGRIIADAFDLGEQAAPWLARLVGRPDWYAFMSFGEDGTPAGTGCLYVRDGVGWLDWGATAPAFRGRGGQSAVLAARIEAALDLGCVLLATETGEAVPGDPQHSYNNIQRAGFSPTTLRANYAPKS